MWTIKTYESERPGLAEEWVLDERVIGHVIKVKCSGCGLYANPFQLIDLSDAPAAARAALDLGAAVRVFRCDGCVAKYERNEIEWSEGGATQRMRDDILIGWQSAPAASIDAAKDTLDLRDMRRAAKRQAAVFREEEFQARPDITALAARIAARRRSQ